jgi:hypothetical protein
MSMSNYWFRDRTKSEDSGKHLMRYFAEMDRWEQRYTRFAFHLASWNTKTVVAIFRESKRPVSPSWRAQGISSQFLAFGVPFGEARGSIACLSVMSYHDHLPSASFLKDSHPELLTCLEHYEPDELLQLAHLAQQHQDETSYAFPSELMAGRQKIGWRIPQQILPEGVPVQVATMSARPATFDRSYALRNLVEQLGPRSILIDLRDAPDTHQELQRQQGLKRNTFSWPKDRATQRLHPIALRDAFGMKYRHVPQIMYFARVPYTGQPLPEAAQQSEVWLYRPESCSLIVNLLKQGHPLLLIDDGLVYGASLRRAIALHLLSLFSTQIEIIPES